ncbi:DUF58 domain-containing protein [Marinicella sp. W31]|uniref:DUF58 domain-containing protein n=1 Tax=Marinicella sp. W31 TaxID=3023713 RepID=UPI003757D466
MNTANPAKKQQPDPRVVVTADTMVRQRHHARQFNLTGIKKATSAISGLHDSRFRGRGMDYLESRAYQIGDDIRNMDWRVTARTGTAHTKLFQEERERPVYIVVDTNRSMHFGTRLRFKSVVAATAAAVLGWSSISQGDRIGVMTFGCHGIHPGRALAGKKGMMNLITHVVDAYAVNNQHTETLSSALQQLRHINRPGSLIIVISDFYHLGSDCKRHLVQLRKHNDVLAVLTHDPFELHSMQPAYYGIGDAKRQLVLDAHKSSTRKRVENIRRDSNLEVVEQVAKAGVAVLPLQTDQPVVNTLKQGLKNPAVAFANWIEQAQ